MERAQHLSMRGLGVHEQHKVYIRTHEMAEVHHGPWGDQGEEICDAEHDLTSVKDPAATSCCRITNNPREVTSKFATPSRQSVYL